MSHVVQQQTEEPFVELEELYKMVGWPLYRKFEHAYDSFKKAARYFSIFYSLYYYFLLLYYATAIIKLPNNPSFNSNVVVRTYLRELTFGLH